MTPTLPAPARGLLDEARLHGGLAPVDLERFWADDAAAQADPFGANIPQVPLGIRMSWECIPTELGVEVDTWRYLHDEPYALALNKAYNDQAERIVGRRLLNETPADPAARPPAHKALHDVFEARNEWHAGSWWLRQSAHDADGLEALLDRVERRLEDLRSFLLPEDWDDQKRRCLAAGGRLPLYRGQRGPVTFAASVYGPENLIYLILDEPDLAVRFRDTIRRAMLEMIRVLDEEAGYTPETAPRGFGFADDNCCLLTPEMYELFGYPILQAIFERCAPGPADRRYQHSDSPMGHLLPVLGRLNLTGVNFGPTVRVAEIRRHLPRAVIDGQLAPFTFSRNEEESILAEFLRDFGEARAGRGLRFATAGSINDGSRLTGMRLVMAAIQRFGRYDA